MSSREQKFSIKVVIFLFMCLLIGITEGRACQIQIDDNYQKNILMAHGVSFHDVSLSSASGTALTGYDVSFSTGESLGSCPDYINVSGRVAFNHVKSAVESCTYAVNVTVKTYMGEEMPDGPIEEVIFEEGEATCSISFSRVRLPKKIKQYRKPMIKKPFPR